MPLLNSMGHLLTSWFTMVYAIDSYKMKGLAVLL